MRTIPEHLAYVKGQPHHIRRRIAFVTAGVGAGIIAFIWLASSLATGAFAVRGSSFADATGRPSADVAGRPSADVAGLAAAAASISDPNAPARIQIIDTASSTRPAKKAEETTIPF